MFWRNIGMQPFFGMSVNLQSNSQHSATCLDLSARLAVKLIFSIEIIASKTFCLPVLEINSKRIVQIISSVLNMSQTQENTWSATDAKENQQEIAKLVRIVSIFIYASYIDCLIEQRDFFFGFQVDNLSLKKDGDGTTEDESVDVAK